ncbi:MAG: vancomycin resistance protein, partial [Oscillospiraceae bacterium]
YRAKNNTDAIFQFVVYTTDEYLCGELLCDKQKAFSYHVFVKEEYFYPVGDDYYRYNEVYRKTIEKPSGNCVEEKLIIKNHAKVMYDISCINLNKIRRNN